MKILQDSMRRVWKQCLWLWDFLLCVVKQFEKDACLTTSTALAYTSLFSLMPILIVSYSVFSGFPEFEQLGPKVEAMLLSNFVPEVAADLRQVGQSFMLQASELSLTSFLGLLVVAAEGITGFYRSQGAVVSGPLFGGIDCCTGQ